LVRIGKKWGYIVDTGSIIIAVKGFEDAYSFSESGLAPVKDKGKWGYINVIGEMEIKPQFDAAGSFSENLAPVQIGSLCGYVNKSGKITITPQFDSAGIFSEGTAPVKRDGKWGFINKKGEIIINNQYNLVSNFKNGLCWWIKEDNWGYIDKKGNTVWQMYDDKMDINSKTMSAALKAYEDLEEEINSLYKDVEEIGPKQQLEKYKK
ncbi:MAG TPA: WG repeat-containing protein, partial [Spirochaetota bacterium]|nr:WG repeat-containing protein [Spirochaetota bacterium]